MRSSRESTVSTVWVAVAVTLVVGALYFGFRPLDRNGAEGDSDYEDLSACAFLTSLDSTRSLYLSKSHVARQSTTGGNGLEAETGTWALVDDERHTYRITIEGRATTYTRVTAPEGEGCMLVAGDPKAADLTKSWFSTLQDPK